MGGVDAAASNVRWGEGIWHRCLAGAELADGLRTEHGQLEVVPRRVEWCGEDMAKNLRGGVASCTMYRL